MPKDSKLGEHVLSTTVALALAWCWATAGVHARGMLDDIHEDFEALDEKGKPANWRLINDAQDQKASLSLDTGVARSGDGSLRLVRTAESGKRVAMRYSCRFAPNSRYQVAFWVRSEKPLQASATVYMRVAGAAFTAGPEWRKVTMVGVAGGGGGFLQIDLAEPGTLWVDDARAGSSMYGRWTEDAGREERLKGLARRLRDDWEIDEDLLASWETRKGGINESKWGYDALEAKYDTLVMRYVPGRDKASGTSPGLVVADPGHFVMLRARSDDRVAAACQWTGRQGKTHRADLPLTCDGAFQRNYFPIGRDPAWRGVVSNLQFVFSGPDGMAMDLAEVKMLAPAPGEEYKGYRSSAGPPSEILEVVVAPPRPNADPIRNVVGVCWPEPWGPLPADLAVMNPGYVRLHNCLSHFEIVNKRDGKITTRFDRKGQHSLTIDEAIEAILDTGAKPHLCIFATPGDLLGKKHGPDHLMPPHNADEWNEGLRQWLVHNMEKWDTTAWIYEFWNEPWFGFWYGTDEQFVELAYNTLKTVKETDPKALVGLAGFVSDNIRSGRAARIVLEPLDRRGCRWDFISLHGFGFSGVQGAFRMKEFVDDWAKTLTHNRSFWISNTEWGGKNRDGIYNGSVNYASMVAMHKAGWYHSCNFVINGPHGDGHTIQFKEWRHVRWFALEAFGQLVEGPACVVSGVPEDDPYTVVLASCPEQDALHVGFMNHVAEDNAHMPLTRTLRIKVPKSMLGGGAPSARLTLVDESHGCVWENRERKEPLRTDIKPAAVEADSVTYEVRLEPWAFGALLAGSDVR